MEVDRTLEVLSHKDSSVRLAMRYEEAFLVSQVALGTTVSVKLHHPRMGCGMLLARPVLVPLEMMTRKKSSRKRLQAGRTYLTVGV